ncbi:zinc-binding alcohol dehydrogenase [Allomuricauda sp. d1]|uniref:zinc-binding alcohol dehydrogenase n=1 Tax=Allomuricauda sp. d1 TaxID=3136725 RepID=UPI0031E363CC
MKVKELPKSIYHTLRLRLTPSKKFDDNRPVLPVIVSLATIPSRLNIVHLTIRSILLQKKRPKKIVLWVHRDCKYDMPEKLSRLQNKTFEIHFSELTSSHRKLVNTMQLYPEETVVTCDDDMIYQPNWFPRLYDSHRKHPNMIIANQTRCIMYDENGNLLSYKNWGSGYTCENSKAVLPIGAGGTLYPPNSLHEDALNSSLFLKLTPKADDLWFKAMSLKKGTLSYQAKNIAGEPIPIFGSQKESLKKSNIKQDKNRDQWQAVADHYGLHDLIR